MFDLNQVSSLEIDYSKTQKRSEEGGVEDRNEVQVGKKILWHLTNNKSIMAPHHKYIC
jgi:hypothetical protein